jgi:hypothetical protein
MDQSIPHDKPSVSNVPDSPLWRKALDNPWLMLVLLFFVTAALGIPFLWMSRGFSTVAKVVLTVVVLLWTALILWLFWLVMVWSWTRVSDALGW